MGLIIAGAIPVFFILIGLELYVARRRGVHVFRFVDSITDLSCGLGNQVMAVLFGASILAAHQGLYERFTLVRFAPNSLWPWLIAIFGVDFIYYWWHRCSHEVNVMWAAHVVHHQSEDYNLAVALRQALFTSFTSVPFYALLAFAGVPAAIEGASIAISMLYQFWIHTELVGRMPKWFETVMNTPSHHRVHHGTNPEYLDRNYAAIFIVWDRMFGTFEPEDAPVVYGITKPFASFNPIWANFQYLREMWHVAQHRNGLLEKLGVLLERPGWNPNTRAVDLPEFSPRSQFVKFDVPKPSRALTRWIVIQFAILTLGLMALLGWGKGLASPQIWAAGLCIFAATAAWSGLVEKKSWARPLEAVRLLASLAVVAWIASRI
jgi:sterol desaturase/sphingolipid hydroxylase (fatty acid hydroxylase superfamily)